jgi:hypothetical protein
MTPDLRPASEALAGVIRRVRDDQLGAPTRHGWARTGGGACRPVSATSTAATSKGAAKDARWTIPKRDSSTDVRPPRHSLLAGEWA